MCLECKYQPQAEADGAMVPDLGQLMEKGFTKNAGQAHDACMQLWVNVFQLESIILFGNISRQQSTSLTYEAGRVQCRESNHHELFTALEKAFSWHGSGKRFVRCGLF